VTRQINQDDKFGALRKRVLVVDDEAPIRDALSRVLRLEQYDVVCASSGRQAIQQFCQAEIDLVLLDLNFPDEDGWEICRQLTDLNPLLPVIIISARPGQSSLLMASKARALMEKPLDLPLLLRMVSEILQGTVETENTPSPAPCRAGGN
jgi:CheY-like chemotaxis protein